MVSTTTTATLIRNRLQDALGFAQINIIDESAKHAKHQGAIESGGGHFIVEIVADKFQEMSKIERHKFIYMALGDAMGREIHAISISAKTVAEAATSESLK